jgi:DNA-binding transcriptional MerR regulator
MTRKAVSREEWIVYRKDPSGSEICCLTVEGLSRFSRLSISTLRQLAQRGLIAPLSEEPSLFPQENIRRVAKIERLRTQLQLNLDSLEVVLRLLDRMEEMEREIASLRRGFGFR